MELITNRSDLLLDIGEQAFILLLLDVCQSGLENYGLLCRRIGS